MKKMASSALLTVFLMMSSALLERTSALFCWQNSNYSSQAAWSIQKCNTNLNESSCLAQYRLHNRVLVPSYFGCHTTAIPCDGVCNPEEGQKNDYSCCCSGDLCNNVPPSPEVNGSPYGGCEAVGCSHSCVEVNRKAQCYCAWGYKLDSDGRTCTDIDECAYNNGGCEELCHNENGTGHHCTCPHDNQMLAEDGLHCNEFSGLMCYNQRCNATWCSPRVKEHCDNPSSSPSHCQATYRRDVTGVLELRLLSCFSGQFPCEQGGCTARAISPSSSIYYCCCDDHLCNGKISFE